MMWDGETDQLTEQVIGAAIEVHRHLGPGLLESAYQACLAEEFRLRGIVNRAEVDLPIEYKGIRLDVGYRMDFVVNDELIVELKCVDEVLPIHEAQLLTYMKLSGIQKGLILNFKEVLLKDGIRRRRL